MQTVQREQHNLSELQASLDAYLDKHMNFAELRTQWITTLADQPKMRNRAVRLIYQQPSDRNLADGRALALKRICEAAIPDGDQDWTVVLEEDDCAESPDGEESRDNAEISSTRSAAVVTAAKTSDRFTPGYVLNDRFVLEEPLGGGGIGKVFRARDRVRQQADAQAAMIAVKILRDEYRTKPELLLALQRETVLAQSLSHPNIVRMHDFYQDGETYFLTMELLEGETLQRLFSRLQPATVPTEFAMKIIAGMCRGLLHAHANGLIHADFKPGNVFLTTDSEPKIFDFGSAAIAASENQHGNGSVPSAFKELRAITPAYSSCNRLEGGTPGFSDDVYSLSCVIYELLAGRHPYDRKSALVARELNLRPSRIEGLTDLQWRTLASGLMPSRQDRATEIHDLQEAFTQRAPAASPAPAVRGKRRRIGMPAAILAGFLLGAGSLYAIVKFDFSMFSSNEVAPEETPVAATEATPTVDEPSAEPVRQDADSVSTPADSLASEAQAAPTKSRPFEAQSGPPIPTGFLLNAAEFQVLESSTALAVQINRQGDVSEPVNVHWTTFAGSADPQLDYGSFFRRVVYFDAGEESKTIFVPIVSDNIIESDENFEVALGVPGNGIVLVQPYSATVTIIDDDF